MCNISFLDMEKRPRIKLTKTVWDKLFEAAGFVCVAASWVIAIAWFSSLPDTIPTHFNFSGEADGFGGPGSLFIIPSINIAMFLGMYFLNKRPDIFNYQVKITEENALRMYTLSTKLIRVLNSTVAFLFLSLEILSIYAASCGATRIGAWVVPSIVIILFLPIVWYIRKTIKQSKPSIHNDLLEK